VERRETQRTGASVRPAIRHLPTRPPGSIGGPLAGRPALRPTGAPSPASNAPVPPASIPPASLGGRPVPPVRPMAPMPTTGAPGTIRSPLVARAAGSRAATVVAGRPRVGAPIAPLRGTYAPAIASRTPAPNLRRNVCPHFYLTGPRGALPTQAPHLLKALIRQEQNISRCQLRGGVHLESGYIADVCMTPRFNQCVFYEDGLDEG
jgi:hypothetical protein